MAKHYIALEKGMMFEQRFTTGTFKGQLCARGGIDMNDNRWGDWTDDRTPVGTRPRTHVRIRGGVALEVRSTSGKGEGQIILRGITAMDGHKLGQWEKFYADGRPEWSHGYGFRDKKHGRWLAFYPNGKKRYDRYYDNDVPFGPCITYFDNGQIQHKGLFDQAGIKEGEWVEHARDGRVLWHILYENGKKKKIMQTPEGPADYAINDKSKTTLDEFIKNATFASEQEERDYKNWLNSVGLTPTI